MLAEFIHLGLGHINDVRLVRVPSSVVLVIFLGNIERLEWLERGNDRIAENARFVQLLDVSLGDSLLFVVGVKDCGSILAPNVIALPVELSGIVRDGKVNFQQLSECRLTRIVAYFNRFSMVRSAAAYGPVICAPGAVSGVAIANRDYSMQFLKHGFNAPEAAARQHGGLLDWCRGQRRIDFRVRKISNRNSAGVHRSLLRYQD